MNEKRHKRPALEWIVGAIGLVLTIGILGYTGWQAFAAGQDAPPSIALHVRSVEPVGNEYLVDLIAVNEGPSTASVVRVRGELVEGDRVIETSEITFDYLPGRSRRKGGLMFRRDPAAAKLRLKALGYVAP